MVECAATCNVWPEDCTESSVTVTKLFDFSLVRCAPVWRNFGGTLKTLSKLSALMAVVVASATFASAETIQLGSYATGASSLGNANTAMNYAGFQSVSTTPSVGTGSSYFLDPSTVWAPAVANSTWVGSAANAG